MPERNWRYEGKSSPGTFHETSWDGQVWRCSCRGFRVRKDCSHLGLAMAEPSGEGLGYDPFQPEPGESPRLFTSAYWAWRSEMGVACQVTVGAPPADFPVEVDPMLQRPSRARAYAE